MSEESYDIVVVGAGPAGSMAAKFAADAGAKTLLLERDANIGLPVRCGEAVGIKNIAKFCEIDSRWVAAEIEGMIMYSPDGQSVTVSQKGQVGAVLERSLFDRHLSEMAASSGAEIRTRTNVDGLIMSNGSVKGVTASRFGKQTKYHAELVIAADGVDSRLGRWAGIRTQISAHDLESAYQIVVSGIDYDYKRCHFYFGAENSPGGYIWIFPKGESTAAVGIGVEVSSCTPGFAYRKLEEFIRYRFGKPAVIGEMAGGVPVSRALKNPFADGIILVGDAARHCNPLTGGGIYTAMVAGREAGKLGAKAVAKGDTSVRELKNYNKLIDSEIVRPHKRAYRISKAVGKLSDEDMNRTARDINSIPPEKRSLRNIFLKGLASQPKLVLDVIASFL